MIRMRTILVAAGALCALAMAGTCLRAADSPEQRLRARIAGLHAEVDLLEVERQAARDNLLEGLKKLGKHELGDQESTRRKIRDEFGQLMQMMLKMTGESGDALDVPLKTIQAEVERRGDKEEKEQFKLFADLVKGGETGERAEAAVVELELKLQLRSARREMDRMRAAFLDRSRQLHQKKLELADAEAEYRATK